MIESGRDCSIHILDKEPEQFQSHYGLDVKPPFDCKGRTCDLCSRGIPKKTRFAINVWDFNDKGSPVKVLEGGPMIFNQIYALFQAYNGNLDSVDFKVSRMGTKMETRYIVVPVVPSRFVPAMLEGHKLHNLNDLYQRDVVELEEDEPKF
jgi:hypothetical protein